jgi:hypothetical protein
VAHQGTFDVWVVAGFFLLGGPTPLMLMLAPLAGHVLLSCILFALLRRVLPGRASAFIVCLTLVFTTHVINGIIAFVPRQWSITVALAGVALVAWPTRRTPLRLALGITVALSSIYLDLICTLWVPALGLLTLMICLEQPREPKTVALRLAGAAAGTVMGISLVLALRAGANHPAASDFGLSYVERNWPMLRDTSLPFLLGAKVWIPGGKPPWEFWQPPVLLGAIQWFGAASLVLLVLASTVLVFSSRVRVEVKRLVVFGIVVAATTLGGFLTGTFPGDLLTTRYLGPLIWSLPFSLAALASAVRPRMLLALLAPYLLVAAIGGWIGFGPWVEGARSHFDARAQRPEVQLGDFLRQRGYTHGYATYWLSYRLTFLWKENPVIAALDSIRYYPYVEASDRAKRKAFIFEDDPTRVQRELADLRRHPGRVEVVDVAGFTVILYDEQ